MLACPRTPRAFLTLLTIGTAWASPVVILAQPSSTFDDGTLQGWTKVQPFGGSLYVSQIGGHPGGYLIASDTVGGGGGLLVKGPAAFSGDLRTYVGLSWDEFVFHHGPANVYPSRPVLLSSDGTMFLHEAPLGPKHVWNPRSVSWEAINWTRISGTSSLDEVLQNATVAFELEGSTAVSGPEIGLDNVALVLSPTIDCNSNGIADDQDIAAGTSEDCNADGVPDECQADVDGDGVIDACDACPFSQELSTALVIDGCDTGVLNQPWGIEGCTMADALAECEDGAWNHRAFVRCVAWTTGQWKRAGLIDRVERRAVVRCAKKADTP